MDSSISRKYKDSQSNLLTPNEFSLMNFSSSEISDEVINDSSKLKNDGVFAMDKGASENDEALAMDLSAIRGADHRFRKAGEIFTQNPRPTTSTQTGDIKGHSFMDFRIRDQPYSFHVGRKRQLTPVEYSLFERTPSDCLPVQFELKQTLRHGGDVSAVVIDSQRNQVYTGGKGCVKLWDIEQDHTTNIAPICEFNCMQGTVRCMKISNDCTKLIIGGDSHKLSVWDLTSRFPQFMMELNFRTGTCNDLAITSCSRFCFMCCSDGMILKWDLVHRKFIRKYAGHRVGATCIDISGYNEIFWTGSLDDTVRSWDIRTDEPFKTLHFSSPISSLSAKSILRDTCWLAVGLADSDIEILNGKMYAPTTDKYQLSLHKSSVSSLRFANSGRWFVSTGKDGLINTWKSFYGPILFQLQDPSGPGAEILCCDLSAGDRYLVTGIKNMKARVYEVWY